jgi:hypothetical protein
MLSLTIAVMWYPEVARLLLSGEGFGIRLSSYWLWFSSTFARGGAFLLPDIILAEVMVMDRDKLPWEAWAVLLVFAVLGFIAAVICLLNVYGVMSGAWFK